MASKSNIIVPWDFSEHSHAALQFALEEFEPSAIKVICILEPPSPYVPGMEWGEKAEEQARANCTQQFFDKQPNHPGLEFVTEFGDPATEIARYAKEHKTRYIVISTHGKGGVQRLFMGSVAAKVASKAKCPILLLPNGWFEARQSQSAKSDAVESS